jgi:glycosyltransferase involved in cell wall biosynthesis
MIHLDFNIYPEDVLISLYNACDCFVLPSRGEGWSLPMCEAMSMGMPTIGTRWSGNLEFMNDDNSYLINIENHAIEPRCNWITNQYVGRKFAVPNMTHLKQLMRYVYDHKEEAVQKGEKARMHIVKNFDWSVSCKRMKDRLTEITNRK